MKILPRLTDTFTGREHELGRMLGFFPKQHIFFIKGIGGIGKTTTALAFLEELKKKDLEKRIIWVRCLEGWKLEELFFEMDSWFKDAGEDGFSGWLMGANPDFNGKILALINILNKREFIVFVDDFHFIRDEGITIFFNLLHTYLSSRMIFISREDIPLSPLEKLDILEEKIEGLPAETGALLLCNLLDLHRSTLQHDHERLVEIAKNVAGHPLLLKLIASLLVTKSLDMEKLAREGTPREILQYLFSSVLSGISSTEHGALEVLALTPVPLSEESIESVLDIGKIKMTLMALERKFLLEKDTSGRVFIHHLISRHIAEEMSEARKKELHLALGEYFEKSGFPHLAFSHFIEGEDHSRASIILAVEAPHLCSTGQYELLIEDASKLESAIADVEPRVLLMKSNALSNLGRWEESLAVLEKLERVSKDKAFIAESLSSIAGVYLNTGNLDKAFDFYNKSMALSKSAKRPATEIKCLNYLAFITTFRGEIGLGKEYLQKSMEKSERENYEPGMGHALRIKGTIHHILQEHKEALEAGREALRLATRMGSSRLSSWARFIMGQACTGLARYDEASEILRQNIQEAKKIGDTQVLGFTYMGLGELALEKGELQEAHEAFSLSSQNFIKQGNLLGDAIAGMHGALTHIAKGDHGPAEGILEKSLSAAKKFSHTRLEAECIFELSELSLDRGEIERAQNLAEKSLTLVNEKVKIPSLEALSHLLLAETAFRRHSENEAREHIKICRESLDESRHPELSFKAYYLLSVLSEKETAGRNEYEEGASRFFGLLSGNGMRAASRFRRRFDETLARKYEVYLNDKRYLTDEKEVTSLRERKESFDFFMDIPGKQLYIKELGEVDIFKKKILSSLLLHLVKLAGKGYTPEEIFKSVWGYAYEGELSAGEVRKNISRLRNLVEPDREAPRFIKHREPFMKEKGRYYFNDKSSFCLITE